MPSLPVHKDMKLKGTFLYLILRPVQAGGMHPDDESYVTAEENLAGAASDHSSQNCEPPSGEKRAAQNRRAQRAYRERKAAQLCELMSEAARAKEQERALFELQTRNGELKKMICGLKRENQVLKSALCRVYDGLERFDMEAFVMNKRVRGGKEENRESKEGEIEGENVEGEREKERENVERERKSERENVEGERGRAIEKEKDFYGDISSSSLFHNVPSSLNSQEIYARLDNSMEDWTQRANQRLSHMLYYPHLMNDPPQDDLEVEPEVFFHIRNNPNDLFGYSRVVDDLCDLLSSSWTV